VISNLEYSMDPMGRTRFYGIYRGKVVDINDPLKKYRVKLQVPQVLGAEVSEWASPCLPVTSNDQHPDHRHHTSSEVVSLLSDHSGTFTTSDGHSVTVSFHHGSNGNSLAHPHVATKETVYDQVVPGPHPEHTLHRKVPRVGQTIWVMFEAGDPDHPVWMGVLS
jgi:hypothetical protein